MANKKKKEAQLARQVAAGRHTPKEFIAKFNEMIPPPSVPGNVQISLHTARKLENIRNEKDRLRDECQVSKKITAFPTVAWTRNPGGSDIPGIDAPGECKEVPGAGVICTLPKKITFGAQCKGIQKGTRKRKAAAKKRKAPKKKK